MKRARRKETNGSHQSLSKKQDESHGNDLFSYLPLDLKKEILMKLPTKSLANLTLVSKLWSSTLCAKDFTELYLTRSSFRPRFLFATMKGGIESFHTCLQENQSADDYRMVCINWKLNSRHKPCSSTGGLICYEYDGKVVIGNPFKGKSVTLPRVKTRRRGILTFFGYDSVNDVYKVLCMTVKSGPYGRFDSEEHQVFTLGDQKRKWRMITCKYPHLPIDGTETKGLCKNGVVYYIAWINNHQSLISFDLRSEDFNVIKLPNNFEVLEFYNLVKFSGKIALTTDSCVDDTLDLLVLQNASKQEWSKVSISVPSCDARFLFSGATLTGELIFVPDRYYSPKPFYILCYNLKESNFRKVVIQGTIDDYPVEVFFDHVENPMTLP